MTQAITKDMNIQDLANKHPEAVMVMAERGLHCFGCHGASMDSVEQGAKGHGMSEEDIEQMVKEMNEAVELKHAKKTEAVKTPIASDVIVTEKAAAKLKEFAKAEGKEGYGFRIEVVPGGCSGYSYSMDFDNAAKDGDIVLTKHGMKVFMSKDSLDMLNGATVEYVDGLHGSGFKIENPNAKSSCGCGKSFA